MGRVGKHEGSSEPEAEAVVDRQRLFKHALGLTLTLIAWGLLVWLAIDFGTEARTGSGLAWFFLLIATLGATACLFLGLSIGARLMGLMKGSEPVEPPPRIQGGKRAAR